MIRKIQEETGTDISIEDDGTVTISGASDDSITRARATVEGLVEEAEVGRIYEGTVTGIKDFGAFVEILPGTEGLLHVSEISHEYTKDVRAVIEPGQKIRVKVLSIDENGKIRLSKKAVDE
jgi:polyribonucleotide nucleotidyltransferase